MQIRRLRWLFASLIFVLTAHHQTLSQTLVALPNEKIVERVAPAVVLVLTGKGAGRYLNFAVPLHRDDGERAAENARIRSVEIDLSRRLQFS
jgi:hypothetical protein